MRYYCPYCKTEAIFPEPEESPKVDINDLAKTRLAKTREKPIRCTGCSKMIVKSECKREP